MIVVDSSAVVAIIMGEPLADALTQRLVKERVGTRSMSTATYLETGTVLAGRWNSTPLKAIVVLDELLSNSNIDLVPFTVEQASIAMQARIKYGRGFRSGAQLNLGDCFSYALAKSLSAPLLYTGRDFDKTDVARALA